MKPANQNISIIRPIKNHCKKWNYPIKTSQKAETNQSEINKRNGSYQSNHCKDWK